jgi:hypothetical protein
VINDIGWQGLWKIKVIDSKTREVIEETEVKNRIMNLALDELLKVLEGDATDMELKYMALGTDDTPLTNNDLTLGTEIFRTPPISQNKTGTGELTTVFTVLDSEAVGNIEEIGIFGGTGAGAGVDTGLMISRILWKRTKTNSEEIQFSRVDRMVR